MRLYLCVCVCVCVCVCICACVSMYLYIILGIYILHRVCLAHVELEGPVQHAMDTEDELKGSVASR